MDFQTNTVNRDLGLDLPVIGLEDETMKVG
jgi:hypothetical protein